MAKKEETQVIELKPLSIKQARITIAGDGDLVLNKMNDCSARKLTDERKNKAKDTAATNVWEEVITAMHWYGGKPTDFTEEGLREALTNNAPCITAFGLKSHLDRLLYKTRLTLTQQNLTLL